MKREIKFILLLFTVLCLFSCIENHFSSAADYVPEIAIEGCIETGTPARVILSRTVSFKQQLDTAYLMQHVIRSAKVSVSDGEQIELLTLGTDNNYMSPYIYYGTQIIGEAGKTYSLKIEYDDRVFTAETTIPEPVAIDSCWFVRSNGKEKAGHIHISFCNTSNQYYQIATRVSDTENIFTPCLYGNFPASLYEKGEIVSMQINRGPILSKDGGIQFQTWFWETQIVFIKLRTQTKDSYDFWTSWQNEILNAQNPIFPAHTNLKSNINGGIGCWSGYGTIEYCKIIRN
ncbi:MAG: DUF4249 domain-containing protein [Dysgonamonadaceae bacterium]|jgi:hypothetical protein|nr:DUF4249 domain-containing protein [Dysgonamonadaceae bacterium]